MTSCSSQLQHLQAECPARLCECFLLLPCLQPPLLPALVHLGTTSFFPIPVLQRRKQAAAAASLRSGIRMRGGALQSPHVPNDSTGSFSARREREVALRAGGFLSTLRLLASHGAAPGGCPRSVPASEGGRRRDPGCTSGLAATRLRWESQT